ncbi:MAG: cupin domain-containing protein [Sediminibacterium sp.]|nr:cupin domain-containing protein [Sediminibacterium sp.]
MPLYQISNIEPKPLIEGYTAQFIHTASATYSHVRVVAGAALPMHQHPHEQVSYVLEGEFELTVNGTPHRLVPGQVFVIPSNTPHAGLAITDCFILDVFTPVREDYREKGGVVLG